MNKQEDPILLELHYLPVIHIYRFLKDANSVYLQAAENYQKQSLRNRTYILSASGVLTLTIPVKHDARKFTEVKIDYDQNWLKNHIKAITSCYKHTPYFEYYFPYLEEIYNKRIPSLFTLNMELFNVCNRFLNLKYEVALETDFKPLSYKHYITQEYLSKTQQSFGSFSIPYRQVFGTTFTPNLSILDLIFNMGPDSKFHL